MKQLTLIVHANFQQDLADALRALPQVGGFTFTAVEGHSALAPGDPFLSERDRVVGYTSHVRVDVVLADDAVSTVLDALRQSPYGLAGRAHYWITSVERGGRL